MTTKAPPSPGRPTVVIVGAGFGGLAAARALRDAPVDTLLVDQHNHHTFTPLLYQVATALLEPSETERSFGLNDLPEALELRNEILTRFEQASWATDAAERRRLLTFAVVGGGPTGVEFAGALAELVRGGLSRDFRRLDPSEVEIVLVEASDSPLPPYAKRLRRAACRALERKGVRVVSGAKGSAIDGHGLHLDGDGVVPARTVVWGAGVRAAALADALGLDQGFHHRGRPRDRSGAADR